jgi:hypothetical protein
MTGKKAEMVVLLQEANKEWQRNLNKALSDKNIGNGLGYSTM